MVRAWIVFVVSLASATAGCLGGQDAHAERPEGTVVAADGAACDLPLLDERIRMRELDVAVDPNDRDRIAVGFIGAPPVVQGEAPHDWPYWVGVALSEDGGASWGWTWAGSPPDTNIHLGTAADGRPARLTSDPIVLFTEDGALLLSFLALDVGLRHLVVRYAPGGLEQESVALVAEGSAHPMAYQAPTPYVLTYNEKQHLRLDPATGDVLMGWEWRTIEQSLAFGPVSPSLRGAAMFSLSTDGGRTWAPPVQVSPTGGFGGVDDDHAGDPHPIRGRDGVYNLFWLEYRAGEIMHARSDDGKEWRGPAVLATVEKRFLERVDGIMAAYNVEAAMDTSGGIHDGRIYIVTTDFSTGDQDILLMWSDDGVTWSPLRRITGDAVGNGNDQFQPALAVATDGTVGVLYGDRRHAADPDGWGFVPYLAQSTDGGATFEEAPVTTEAGHPRNMSNAIARPPREEHPTYPERTRVGDYPGLDATGQGWFMAWQDGREGTSDVPYSTGYVCHAARP